jgi:hypothetical protein
MQCCCDDTLRSFLRVCSFLVSLFLVFVGWGLLWCPLLSGYVDVRASYRSDLVLLTSRVFFGIVFPTCFSWRGFLYFNGRFSTYFGLFPAHFIVYFFVAY